MSAQAHTFHFGLCACGYRVGNPPPDEIVLPSTELVLVWDADMGAYRGSDNPDEWWTVEEAMCDFAFLRFAGGPLAGTVA